MHQSVVPRVVGGIVVVAVGLCLTQPVAAGEEKFVSWADMARRHGWTDVTSGGPIIDGAPADPRCPGTQRSGGTFAFLCATEDGGRSWRRVFQAGTGLTYIRDFTRTSRVAGVVAISRDDEFPRTLRTGVFWTRDNGEHWYETTRIGPLVEHRAGRLFWRNPGGPLYECDRGRRAKRCGARGSLPGMRSINAAAATATSASEALSMRAFARSASPRAAKRHRRGVHEDTPGHLV